MKFQRHSTRLYAKLGEEVGYPINYHVTGSLRLAHTKARMDEYQACARPWPAPRGWSSSC